MEAGRVPTGHPPRHVRRDDGDQALILSCSRSSSPMPFTVFAFCAASTCLPDLNSSLASAHIDFIEARLVLAPSNSSLLTPKGRCFFFDSSSTRDWIVSTSFGTSTLSDCHSVLAAATAAWACALP